MDEYPVLVNTTDAFEDCWEPFFTLFAKFWPGFKGTIYLNTEEKLFSHGNLDIVSIRNGLVGQRWSDCLLAGLQVVPGDVLFYMQDDYFLYSEVNKTYLTELYHAFLIYCFDCLHVTKRSTGGPFRKQTMHPLVWEIPPGAQYRVSLQAAFWKKESLASCVKPGKSAWQFEVEHNRRLWHQPEKVFCVNRDIEEVTHMDIVPYVFTGVLDGRWNKMVKIVFEENGIAIDFGKRGFFRPKGLVAGLVYELKWTMKKLLYRLVGRYYETLR